MVTAGAWKLSAWSDDVRRALLLFVRERFSPLASVPMAVALYLGPARLLRPGPGQAAIGVVTVFLMLLSLRIADDLDDIDKDRRSHPERGLPSGRIGARPLRRAGAWLAVLTLLLNISEPARLLFLCILSAHYLLYFGRLKRALPRLVRPFASNLIFGGAVVYAVTPTSSWAALTLSVLRVAPWLGLFSWLGAVAHEYAHNVMPPAADRADGPGYATILGARGTALAASLLFLGAAAAGGALWLALERPEAFGCTLLVTSAALAFLLVRLVARPTPELARPLYVAGMAFFLLPLLALMPC
jgi:4-hydroxybenzoate polyprenyltransferase